jgi:hypothetical protein
MSLLANEEQRNGFGMIFPMQRESTADISEKQDAAG